MTWGMVTITDVLEQRAVSLFHDHCTNSFRKKINPLKPRGRYMYHQFNIQQFYVLPTQLYLCVLYGSQNKQRLFPYTTLTDWFL